MWLIFVLVIGVYWLIRNRYMRSLLVYCFLFWVSAVYAETVFVSIDDYPPYIDKSEKHKGFMSELVVAAFNKAGLDVELSFMPWKRIEDVEIDQRNKLSFAWIWNKQRDERWLFSDVIMAAPTVLVIRKDNPISWQRYEDLKPYVIGLSRGYSYGDEFDSLSSELTIQMANSDLANLRKLLLGRIDLFPVDPYVGSMLLENHFTEAERAQLVLIQDPQFIQPYDMHVVCAKRNAQCKHWLEAFNKGFERLKKEGVVQSMIDNAHLH